MTSLFTKLGSASVAYWHLAVTNFSIVAVRHTLTSAKLIIIFLVANIIAKHFCYCFTAQDLTV